MEVELHDKSDKNLNQTLPTAGIDCLGAVATLVEVVFEAESELCITGLVFPTVLLDYCFNFLLYNCICTY